MGKHSESTINSIANSYATKAQMGKQVPWMVYPSSETRNRGLSYSQEGTGEAKI